MCCSMSTMTLLNVLDNPPTLGKNLCLSVQNRPCRVQQYGVLTHGVVVPPQLPINRINWSCPHAHATQTNNRTIAHMLTPSSTPGGTRSHYLLARAPTYHHPLSPHESLPMLRRMYPLTSTRATPHALPPSGAPTICALARAE